MIGDPAAWTSASLAARLHRAATERTNAVALIDGQRRVTYHEMLARADALAAELRRRGIGPGDLVAVALPRCADQVIAVVGVVRAGAAYVPLDLSHPSERRAGMLADARPRCVVVLRDGSVDGLAGHDVVEMPATAGDVAAQPVLPRPSDPAYVIYTSGSTGRPKGVVVTHHNVSRLFATTERLFAFGPDDVWTLFHSIAFDFSVWEMWGALSYGGRLVIVPAPTARAADAFHDLVVNSGVTVLNQTPSAFRAFDAANAAAGRARTKLRHVIFGGEALDPRTLAGWFAAHGDTTPRLVNMYGITETTVHTTFRPMRASDARGDGKSLIGAPLPDLRIELRGPDGAPVRDGDTGEIFVGGAGVANGYLRRPELTTERFLPDPTTPGGQIYRSGDLARRTPDGDLEYLGRGDAQVKLRGFRIELGEIEAVLRTASGIAEAVVALRGDPAVDARLVAWLVPAAGAAVDPRVLQHHVAARLPDYMVPAAYVRIEHVPRNVNDKVDRSALPAPGPGDLPRATDSEAPRTPSEVAVARLWSEALGVEDVRREDDFVSLGGHSLLATRVAFGCAAQLGREVTGLDVLAARTLAAFAARVDAAPATKSVAPAAVGTAPATPGQVGVLLQQRLAGNAPVLNETACVRLVGRIDDGQLRAAISTTLAAHPAFASRFVERDGRWMQEPAPGAVPPVVTETMTGATDDTVRARLAAFAATPFDLERGPLARAIVVRSGPESCTLLFAAHHAVVDEWSYHLVLEEVGRRLAGRTDPTIDTGPFAHGARRAAADGAAAGAVRAHWAKELEGAALEIEMGCEAVTGAEPHAGAVVEIPLPVSVTQLVRSGLRALGTTEFEAGLAAFAAVLEHEAHRPDLTLLVTLADRDRPAVADVVGYLLDVLPVRVQLAGDPTLGEVLAVVRAAIARTAANRAITVGDSVAAAGLSLASRERGIGAAFYTRQEEVAPRLRIPGVRSEPFPVHLGVAKFDASLYLVSGPDRLAIRLEHRHGAIGTAAARRLAERTARALVAFATAPTSKLAAFDPLTPAERALALAVARGPVGPAAPAPFVPQRVGVVARERAALPAIAESGRTVTYGALLAAADALAARLRELGVGPGHVVPVLGRRSAALVASWLGVLRAGGAYAPVEAEQPASRRGAMIEDCRPVAVVADPAFREGIPDGVPVIDLADPYGGVASGSVPPPSLENEDLAYVVFTSGSTGRPKGVEVGHGALAHIVAWHQKQLAATADDRVPLLSGIGFDATVLETWATLCTGGVVELPDEEVRIDPPRLRDWMIERGVTTAFVPTVLAEALLALPWPAGIPLRMMQTGGEALRSRPRAGLPFRFVNLYGPAEVAVWVTHHLVESDGVGLPAIGVPLDDASTWVVDHRGRLCAPRTIGELWLGGPQVGRGYRGLPERTASSFPTIEMVPGRRERAYRTGDLVRAEDDGLIHFVGRRDTQVKLRGVRIEIGEIEAVLLSHADVAGCAVALRGTPAAPYLAAYVEARDPAHPPAHGALADHVAGRVPRGMVPTRWAIVERLARTTNGKVDRKVLPEIAENAPSRPDEVLPLRTDTERTIARLYAEVLGVPVDSRDADVFRLGGSSLAAVRIVTMISRELGAVPVRAILENPVIEALAAYVDRRRKPAPAPVPSTPVAAPEASVQPVPAAPLAGPGSERFVRLREGSDGVPLFCMPGIGGHAFQYRKLVERMQTRRPVLGLQLYDLEVPPATFESIEDTATAVVREIRKERPRGPYALMGYSFGGLLALEIARQLVGAGEPVELVGLLDAYAPGTTAPEPLLGKVRLHFANLFAVRGLREFFDYLGQRVRGKVRRLLFRTREIAGVGERTPAAIEQRIEEMGVRCWRAMRSYAAMAFPGQVTVFRASRLMDWARVQDPTGTCGWKPWCDDVRVVDIDCKHLDLFHEPHLSTLA
ncbi:MAG: amino acid adenylation domain-containing protein, partial [Planctomycetes bacterium]|nr:amino acid adenylation domain-containing protein [Planctomycetota bacterium]